MSTDAEAISLLGEQLAKTDAIISLDHKDPSFLSWHDLTKLLFQKFLSPHSPYRIRFQRLNFRGEINIRVTPFGYSGPNPSSYVSPRDKQQFQEDCRIAQECIKGATQEIRTFGIHFDEPTPKTKRRDAGGVHQNITGPVSMAIATDNAIQNVGSIGNDLTNLREVAELLMKSMEITGRQQAEARQAIEGIASEVNKPPERRNWRALFDWAGLVLGVANKATDMGVKLSPHLPYISAVLAEAGKRLHGN